MKGFLTPGSVRGREEGRPQRTGLWKRREKAAASSWELSHHYLETPVSSLVNGSGPTLFSRHAHPLIHTVEC